MNSGRASPAAPCVKTVTAADGRALAYLEVGNPQGPLLLHNHGGPSSRLEARLFADAALRHGLRFVCVDRPGIGQSSPQAHPTFASWAADLTTVADELGHFEFGVTGWSGGGPSALAAAAYIAPRRLRHVGYIAGTCYGVFGTNWAADRLSRADALGGYLALRFPPAFYLMCAILGLGATRFRKSFFKQLRKSLNDYDREILQRPEVESLFGAAAAECFAHGSRGLVLDARQAYRRWAFDVTRIERPVHMWQGTDDHLVAEAINQQVAERMPGAIWHSCEGAGHFLAIGAVDAWMNAAAQDLRQPAELPPPAGVR